MKILAIDFGTKITGFAVCNDDETVVVGKGTYRMTGDTAKDASAVRDVIAASGCGKVVIGLPVSERGRATKISRKVSAFVAALKTFVDVPIELHSERLTSAEAEYVLKGLPLARRKKREHINVVAAQTLLRDYIESNSARR